MARTSTTNGVNVVDPVTTAPINVSSAEILTLFSSPKTLLPAPGAGYALKPISITAVYNPGATGYTNANLINFTINGNLVATLSSGMITGTSLKTGIASIVTGVHTSSFEDVSLLMTVANANPTLGNGTLKVYVSYQTLTL